MIEWVIDAVGQGLFWGVLGAVVGYLTGWQVPQSPWGKLVQDKITQAYRWLKAKF